jgi:tetratricopeptide (TPR) repeat protein
MSKLDYLQQKKLNPSDELRETLTSLEGRQTRIKALKADEAFEFLLDLDQLAALFEQFEAAGLDLRPEKGRFQSLQAHIQKQAAPLVKALGGTAAFNARRPTPAPPADKWWWYLDQRVAAEQRRLWRQVGLIMGVITIIVAGVILLFQTILAPSPEVMARLETEDKAYAAIDSGDYQAALAFVEQGLVKVPGDPDLLLLQGVVQEVLGDEAAAAASFEQTQASLNDPVGFYLARSQLQLRVGQPVKAESDARTATQLDETSANAWFLLGQALEFQNRLAEAIPAYQKASELGLKNGESEVVVMARMALGRISASP